MTMSHYPQSVAVGPSAVSNASTQSNSPTALSPNCATEEITTLFVVGFPDDMQEREFQNMFIFSAGFEAATLKIPSLMPQQSSHQQQDDDVGNGSLLGSGRKQIIGFAKFRTLSEALDARDVLNGRRIDCERGCILKAEMAKKNLHTRRFGGDSYCGTFMSAYPGLSLYRSGSNAREFEPAMYGGSGSFSAGSSYEMPFGLGAQLRQQQYNNQHSSFKDYQQQQQQPQHPQQDSTAAYNSQSAAYYDIDDNSNTYQDESSALQLGILDQLSRSCVSDVLNDEPGIQLPIAKPIQHQELNITSGSNTSGSNSNNNTTHSSGSTVMSMSLPTPAMNDLFGARGGFESAVYHNLNSIDTPPYPYMHQFSEKSPLFGSNQNSATPHANAGQHVPFSPVMGSQYAAGRTGLSNDQNNPPCNTLYVGNLPPNTCEDELRMLFAQCLGYKRLLFRSKSNGPMCFVEFESVPLATQAMQSLHGHPLSTSTKGGIRLSFSKNPLGVRNTVSFMFPAGMTYMADEDVPLMPA